MDRGAWQAIVHEVAKNRTQLGDCHLPVSPGHRGQRGLLGSPCPLPPPSPRLLKPLLLPERKPGWLSAPRKEAPSRSLQAPGDCQEAIPTPDN